MFCVTGMIVCKMLKQLYHVLESQGEGGVVIIPVITYWSHYFTSWWCRSGRLAVFPPCECCCAEAEALKGAQQVEAVILGFGFRMNDLRQLAGERHFPSYSPQVACVLWALIIKKKKQKKTIERLNVWQIIRNWWAKLTTHLSTLLMYSLHQHTAWITNRNTPVKCSSVCF